ncbi:unnamed protein product [Arctogadus glacialis]
MGPPNSIHHPPTDVRPEPTGVVSGVENQAIWPVTALHRHHGLDHLDRQKTTAEWPSKGTTAPESYPSPRSVRSGWRPGPPQGSLPPLQDRRPTLHGLGGHWVDHLPGVFPGTTGALSGGWTTVMGQETGMRGRKRLAVRVGDREVMHELWLANIQDSCMDMSGAAIPADEGTLAAGGVVTGLWPGGLGLCPVPAFPAALCLPTFLPPRPPKPLMRFGCAVELGSTCSRVSS